MPISEVGWGLLGASLLLAVVVDYLVVRVLLELLRPTARYAALIGRLGKLAACGLWLTFFNTYWHPRHLSAGSSLSPGLRLAEIGGMGLVVLLALASYPWNRKNARGDDV
ncbi:MAG: hypothetical protein FJX77_16485 [Armatimonadetes bacterium]|nr:hypothetical protein [Armatimonadota bacterium]